MRDYKKETDERVAFIRKVMSTAGADGLVFGNSGGKDSALVGILCKRATKNVFAVALPCASSRNFGEDMDDADALAKAYEIPMQVIDLTETRAQLMSAASGAGGFSEAAVANIAPRLRMTALYATAQTKNALVVGTGNRSEMHMGYFTKWGDGAYDLNPIADLTATEVYEFLRYLGAPRNIIEKAPSAGLFEGQTDEAEMGVRYSAIDELLLHGDTDEASRTVIEKAHFSTEHKRRLPERYGE